MVPYKRRYAGRGGIRKRRFTPMYRRPMMTASFAAQVRKVVAAEVKYHYLNNELEIESGAPVLSSFTSIAQGVTATQRIGNWIKPVNLHGTVVISGNPAALGVRETWGVRVFIFVFNEDVTAAPTFAASQFMIDPARPGGPFNILRKGQFSVLWTRFVTVSNNSDNNLFTRNLTFRVNLSKAKKCLYDGPAAVGDKTKFHIYFGAVSEATSPVVDAPTLTLDTMFRYTDS